MRTKQPAPQIPVPLPSVWTDADALSALIAGTIPAHERSPVVRNQEPPPIWNPNAPRTLLILATRFPPDASVGAIRVRKFAKYLCACGWRPVVLTIAPPHGPAAKASPGRPIDPQTLTDLPPGIPVHRLPAWIVDWPQHVARSTASRLRRAGRLLGLNRRRIRAGLAWRLEGLRQRLSLPDPGVWRIGAALQTALRLHRKYRFDAVFTSGMPFSDHLCGLVLRSLIRRPWIADFRDPWVEYVHSPQWHGPLGKWWTRAAEAAVIRAASRVISVNDHMTAQFAARYPTQPRDKFVTILNGFDPADFAQDVGCQMSNVGCKNEPPPSSHPTSDIRHPTSRIPHPTSHIPHPTSHIPHPTSHIPHHMFRLLYAGSLYGPRTPEKLLRAFAQFQREAPEIRGRACLDFIGKAGPYQPLIEEAARHERIRHLGLRPQAEALSAMTQADLNVILLPNVPGGEHDSTAKIYECLGSGRPILAAVPLRGAAAQLLARFDGVTLCDPDDVNSMARAMADCYRRWSRGPIVLSRPASQIAPLTRPFQARQLAAILDHLTARNTARP